LNEGEKQGSPFGLYKKALPRFVVLEWVRTFFNRLKKEGAAMRKTGKNKKDSGVIRTGKEVASEVLSDRKKDRACPPTAGIGSREGEKTFFGGLSRK